MKSHCALAFIAIAPLIGSQPLLAQPSDAVRESALGNSLASSTDGSFPRGVWAAFYSVALIEDPERRRSHAQEITRLPEAEAAQFARFAVDAWSQLEDLMLSQVRRACEDQGVPLSPSALLQRILDDRHRIERFQQVAVADLLEQLGQEAAAVIVDSVQPMRTQLPEPDYFRIAQQQSSSEYFRGVCTQVDPRNLRRQSAGSP